MTTITPEMIVIAFGFVTAVLMLTFMEYLRRRVNENTILVIEIRDDRARRIRDRMNGVENKSRELREMTGGKTPSVACDQETKYCDRAGEYNGYGSGSMLFRCPKDCSCHD